MSLFVNQWYCNTVVIREKLCTPDNELLSVSLRPHYLPREFQQLFFTLVYIHPRANAATAAQLIVDVTHRLDSICPDAPKFILGDFNHCTLTKSLKTYEQYVTCATTLRNSTIDLCYGSVSSAYKSLPMPSLGASYHKCVFLMPVYKPAFRRLVHGEREVKIWSEDNVASLQACLDCTDWDCFSCENTDELCDMVSSYISFCVNSTIPSKKVVVYPNNKPWVTKELKTVIIKKKRTFFTGDLLERRALSREVRREIAKATAKYKNKIEMQFGGSNIRAAWQGLKSIACINKQADEASKTSPLKEYWRLSYLTLSTAFFPVLKVVILLSISLH